MTAPALPPVGGSTNSWGSQLNTWLGVSHTSGGASLWTTVNVKDPAYGAVGDNSTDDTVAFQAALNYLQANGGGILYVPAGEYLISSSLTFINSLGSGSGGLPPTWPGPAEPVLIIQGAGTAWDGRSTRGTGVGTTTIRSTMPPPGRVFDVENAYLFVLQDLDILNSATGTAWGSGTSYNTGQVATYNNLSGVATFYTATASGTNQTPPTTTGSTSAYWTASEFTAVHVQFCIQFMMNRVFIFGTGGAPQFQTGVHVVNGENSGLIDRCYIGANSQCIWMDGGAGLTVSNCWGGPNEGPSAGFATSFIRMDHVTDQYLGTAVPIWASGTAYVQGNHVSYNGNFYTAITSTTGNTPPNATYWTQIGGGAATLSVFNVTTFRGDWAIWANSPAQSSLPAVNEPTFIYINNMQVNRPYVGGVYLGSGSQFWAEYLWVSQSGESASSGTGILFDLGFYGWASVVNSVFQGMAGHGVQIKSGQGIIFTACSFGSCGNGASNTYDDINIGANAQNVTVSACHFDVDIFNTLASNKARSAVYVANGATGINVTGCQGPGSLPSPGAYGTTAIYDLAGGVVVSNGNTGLGLPDNDVDISENQATTTGYTAITTAWPYAAYDGVPGTVYRIKAYGNGVQASTPAQINFQISAFGKSEAVCKVAAGTIAGTAQDFGWSIEAVIVIRTTGSSGTADFYLSGIVQEYSGGTNPTDNAAFMGQNVGTSGVDTTSASTMVIQAEWVTTAATLSGRASTFERLGPA